MNRERIPGDLIEYGGELWRIVKITETGAKAVPVNVQPKVFVDSRTGQTVRFTPHAQMLTFSSQSPLADAVAGNVERLAGTVGAIQ